MKIYQRIRDELILEVKYFINVKYRYKSISRSKIFILRETNMMLNLVITEENSQRARL